MGRRIYTLVYRLKNSPRARRLSLGDAAHLSLSEARQLAREKLREIDLGHNPAGERTAPDVRALAESYIESRGPDFRPRTLAGYQQMAKRLPPSIAHTKAAELRRADLRVHLEKVARHAPVMANRFAQFLKAVFRWGLEEELIAVNPIEGMKRPRKEKKRERLLADSEIALLWKALEPAKPAVAALVKILLLLGQRLGETLAMRWKDLELEADPAVWTIPGEVRKNGRTHVVPLSPTVLRILAELRPVTGDKERVFHKVAYSTREFWFGPVRERALAAGAEYFKPHDLRRTCATGVSRLSNPIVASKILGHTATPGVPAVTSIYDRYDRLPEKAAALTAWGAHCDTLVNGQRRAAVVPLARG
jgi:integrase